VLLSPSFAIVTDNPPFSNGYYLILDETLSTSHGAKRKTSAEKGARPGHASVNGSCVEGRANRSLRYSVSAEDRAHGLVRIRQLQQAPAAIRFLSIEPLLEDLGEIDLEGIHWVIVGGESGAGARPMEKDWVLSIRDQCTRAHVPFFFKQWGGVRKSKAGRELDDQTYDGLPERQQLPVLEQPGRLAAIAEFERHYQRANAAAEPSLEGTG
jgi:hypothetical protein